MSENIRDMNVKVRSLRSDLADILNRVSTFKTRATIMKHGDPIAIIVSLDEWEQLQRLRAAIKRGVYTNPIVTDIAE